MEESYSSCTAYPVALQRRRQIRHVNNTVYFSFYDLGKTEYFASVCPGVDWEKIGIVVVHIEANFVKQIFASDHIAVQTAVSEIGTKASSHSTGD